MTASTLLILAVCRTHVTHDPSKWPNSPQVSDSSVVKGPSQYLGGHGLNFCRGLRIFFGFIQIGILFSTVLPSTICKNFTQAGEKFVKYLQLFGYKIGNLWKSMIVTKQT